MAQPDRFAYPLPRRTRLALAVEADVDVRSIEALLRGEAVAGRAGERAREVLERHGHVTPTAGSAA